MYEERIWRFLKGKLLSDCGAAGLMGNLYAESGLNPVNLQNTHERKLGLSDKEYTQQVDFGLYADFVHDGAGYGLAQWTFWSRKQNLLAFAKSREKSIGDLETQLEFLWKELTESYASLAQMLLSASSVRAASDAVLLQFERPADQSETAKARRAAYGQKYYDQFAGKEAAAMSNSPLVSYGGQSGYLRFHTVPEHRGLVGQCVRLDGRLLLQWQRPERHQESQSVQRQCQRRACR